MRITDLAKLERLTRRMARIQARMKELQDRLFDLAKQRDETAAEIERLTKGEPPDK